MYKIVLQIYKVHLNHAKNCIYTAPHPNPLPQERELTPLSRFGREVGGEGQRFHILIPHSASCRTQSVPEGIPTPSVGISCDT